MNEMKQEHKVQSKAQSPSKAFMEPNLVIQKKLTVGASNDPLEAEADRVADRVVGMSDGQVNVGSQSGALVQRTYTDFEKEEGIQMKATSQGGNGGTASSALTQQIQSSKGGGRPMDQGTQSFMETRFGSDFSQVRIHTGPSAQQMSHDLNAKAFTVGNDIYFNAGQYNPNSGEGEHLLAHELTHTIQQKGIQRKIQKKDGDKEDDGKKKSSFDYKLLPPEIKWRISSFMLLADVSKLKLDYDSNFFIRGLQYKYGSTLSLLMQHNDFKMNVGVVPQTPELKLGATYNKFYLGSSYNFGTSTFGLNMGWGAKPLPYNYEMYSIFNKAGGSIPTLIGNTPTALEMPPWTFYQQNKDDIGNVTKAVSTIKKITDHGKKDIHLGANFRLTYDPINKTAFMFTLVGRFR
ncbi:DUF4157 domain-containing protein [Aureisphaera galaxeae]|uniref:eCIS core domain-containing protein n=1 Tax=Aureisphaera galaxeae TaxID=1538023 RepID=UPI00234FBBC1|nr:DUF4157 domain-containing protein [Aureisphaera galaxeae]MDC8005368.1 DUF4157 domain-containing protein [Aureisphaera galaxeae]